MTEPALAIDDLRQQPQLAQHVIDRIWRAWWQPKGHAISVIHDAVQRNLISLAPTPFCLVAHRAGQFLGTVSLIACDLPDRAELTPWVAALWVEPGVRNSGVATALLDACTAQAAISGERCIYLHCRHHLQPFYEQRGWNVFVLNAHDDGMHILAKTLSFPSAVGRHTYSVRTFTKLKRNPGGSSTNSV